jgi:hypothetical protein
MLIYSWKGGDKMKSLMMLDSPAKCAAVLFLAFGIIVAVSSLIPEPTEKSPWKLITQQQADSGEFEVKFAPGMRGEKLLWGKPK